MTMPISDTRTIMTRRCVLRGLAASDAALLELYASDERVARMTTNIPHPYPPGTAEAFVERQLRGVPGHTVWAIDRGEGKQRALIGVISLDSKDGREAEIGYWVAPAYWGTGYASEAVEAVIAEARRQELRVIRAEVFQDNVASVRVLTRCGFAYEGDGEAHSVARKAVVATFRYRLDLSQD